MKDITENAKKEWAADGSHIGEDRKIINSLYIEPDVLEDMNCKLYNIYQEMSKNEVMYEEYMCDDAEIIITAYGTVGRIAKSSVQMLRNEGIKAGLIRPITLYPFPTEIYAKNADRANLKYFLDVELSIGGQMIEDVKLSVNGKKPVTYFGRGGGNVMSAEDIVDVIKGGQK